MTTEIENAIRALATKLVGDVKPDDALKLTQASLNLAHAANILAVMERGAKS